MRDPGLVWLVLVTVSQGAGAVVSPLDKVSQELKEMKETVHSVQASLITSVSLIQDQLNDFTENIAAKIETRLTSLDSKVSSVSGGVAALAGRAHLWDSFHLHIESWNSQLNSLDQKIEIMRRAQEEKLNDHFSKVSPVPEMNIKIEKIGVQLKDMGGQLVVMDTRLLSLQDKVSASSPEVPRAVTQSVTSLESLVRNLTRAQRHSGRQIRHEAGAVDRVQRKVDQIYSHLVQHRDPQPRFDFLRSAPPAPGPDEHYSSAGHAHDLELEGEELSTAEDKLLALFRRIATPFKRVNKRLMTMESLQAKIESEISSIKRGLESGREEVTRRLTEVATTAGDAGTEQSRVMDTFKQHFASLEQCCASHSADLERFLVTGSTVLDRLDRWSTRWQQTATQKLDRLTQQRSYDHDTLVKGQKVLESLLLELETGARCEQSTGSTMAPLRADTTTAATTTTTTTTDSNYIPHSYHDQDEEHEDVYDYEDDEHLATGCEHVDRTGIVRVGATKLNGGGRDYHTRLCAEASSGAGGWTVGALLVTVTLQLSRAA